MSSNSSTVVRRPVSLRHPSRPDSAHATRNALALGISAALAGGGGAANAQDAEPIELDTLQVEERTIDTNPYAEPGAPYKARISGDPRHVKELAETPQTITVLTQTQIQESGRQDLRSIVQAQPGITLGTGENGNAFGDRYVIRGHEARSDVFVDGLRDPGMTTRESFAVEQIEITKGPSSTDAVPPAVRSTASRNRPARNTISPACRAAVVPTTTIASASTAIRNCRSSSPRA